MPDTFEEKEQKIEKKEDKKLPIEEVPYKKWFLYFFVLTVASAMINFGYSKAALSMATANIKAVYGWTEDNEHKYKSLITTMLPIGASTGSFFAGVFLKRGRWMTYVVMVSLVIFSCVL